MKSSKFLVLLIALLFFSAATHAQKKTPGKNKAEPTKEVTPCEETAPDLTEPPSANKMKIIAEGSNGKVTAPFVFVARSAESLANLRDLVSDLPDESEIDFTQSVVIAAFAGEKRTGGFTVKIEQNNSDTVTITETAPPTGAIVTQALTYPYQIAIVSAAGESPLDVNIPAGWRQTAQNYKIVEGSTIDYAGGIAGIMKKQPIEGNVRVWTAGGLISLIFNIAGKNDADKNKTLNQIASGTFKNGEVKIEHLDIGDFSQGPKPPDSISGTLAGDKMNLILTPLPTKIRDGFSAEGKISAVKVGN